MRKTTLICSVLVAAFALCCVMAPVSAVILEVTCKGEVSTVNPAKNTLTIKNPVQYGCDYPAGKEPVCSWTPMVQSTLTGTVPDAAAFSVFNGAETAVATSLGGAGDQWITLAKLYGSRPNEEFVTELIGDPRTVTTPFIGDYAIVAETAADCTACTGTVCTASEAKVSVKSTSMVVMEKTLKPGESLVYNGRNDGSRLTVKFVAGQAAAQLCPGKSGMTGPQAVSTYVMSIVPPVGTGQVNIRTATTTRRDEAQPSLLPSAAGTPAPEPTKSGAQLPAAVIGALAIISVMWTRARR
jgi:hypothetical protein